MIPQQVLVSFFVLHVIIPPHYTRLKIHHHGQLFSFLFVLGYIACSVSQSCPIMDFFFLFVLVWEKGRGGEGTVWDVVLYRK
jgi:hypothetical protein